MAFFSHMRLEKNYRKRHAELVETIIHQFITISIKTHTLETYVIITFENHETLTFEIFVNQQVLSIDEATS